MNSSSVRQELGVSALLAIYALVLMHLYLPNRGGIGFYLPGNLVGALVLCAVALTALWPRCGTRLAGSRSLPWLLTGGGLLLLPGLWSISPYREVVQLRLLGLGLGLVTFVALLQVPLAGARRRQWLRGLLAAGVLEALLGVAQYAGYWPGGEPASEGPLRPYGVFQQWNVMASFLAMTLALSLMLAGKTVGDNRIERGLRAIAQLLVPFLLVVIMSRVGLLAALLLTPLQLVWLWRKSPSNALRALGRITLGVFLGLLLMTSTGAPRALEQASTVTYRLDVARTVMSMIIDKPWLGWGYGHFEGDFQRTYHELHPQATLSFNLSHPHNELLLWGMEGGMLALVGSALIIWALVRRVRRDARGGLQRLGGCAWVSALPLLLHMMVELPLYQSAAHGVALLVLLRAGEVRRVTRLPLHWGVWLRGSLCVLVAACAMYLANGLYSAWVVTTVERNGLRDIEALTNLPRPTPWEDRRAYNLALAQLLRYSQNMDPQALVQYQAWARNAQLVSPDVSVFLNLAVIARLQGRPEVAVEQLNEARRLFPDDPRLAKESVSPP